MTRRSVALQPGADLAGFRAAARALLAEDVAPEQVSWDTDAPGLLAGAPLHDNAPPLNLPRAVVELVDDVLCHSEAERHALCYALLWRVRHGEPALLEVASDPLVHRLHLLRKAVRRDIHKMHAFLRFRDAGEGRFVAWFEPAHHILDAVAPFFVERFRGMAWSIVTPLGSLHWDRSALTKGAAGRRTDVPAEDAFEGAWRAYYESVFNPARVNPGAMRQHMPKKCWRNMPETAAIADLLHAAAPRTAEMLNEKPTTSRR